MPSVSLKSLLRGCSEGALVVLLLAAAAFIYWPALYAAGSRMDEATLLVYPELMLQGKIAYRDFETFYPPANLCTLAVAFRIFGISITKSARNRARFLTRVSTINSSVPRRRSTWRGAANAAFH